jgi:hypothetical protein
MFEKETVRWKEEQWEERRRIILFIISIDENKNESKSSSICVLFSDRYCYIEQSPPRSEIIYIERGFYSQPRSYSSEGFRIVSVLALRSEKVVLLQEELRVAFPESVGWWFFLTRGGRPEPGDGVIATVNKLHRGWGESLEGISIVWRISIYFLRASSWWSDSLE